MKSLEELAKQDFVFRNTTIVSDSSKTKPLDFSEVQESSVGTAIRKHSKVPTTKMRPTRLREASRL